MPTLRKWTVAGLLDYFMEIDGSLDRRFAFILGAGASFQSGVPMAGQLVDRWLRELSARENHAGLPLAEWATEANLGIRGFSYERAVEHYSEVFARRFEDREEEGHAYLERILHGKEPSFGYSVLAQILAKTRHCVVITTNFDNLVADALAIYTDKLPLVCGHESLAGFVRANPRRPLVLKIHRDLLLAPKNRSHEIAALPEPLADSLRALLRSFTPIVIGYGGNDGSLMNLLGETLNPGDIPGGLFWCYWEGGGAPGEPIMKVMRRHGGALIPIKGFDELMLLLNHRLGYPLMDRRIEEQARERVRRYRENFEALQRRLFPPPELPEDDSAAAEEAEASPAESIAPSPPRPAPVAPASAPAYSSGLPPLGALEAHSEREGARGPRPTLSSRSATAHGPLATRSIVTNGDTAAEIEQAEGRSQSQLEQAAQALVHSSAGAPDWWKLKLDADSKPTSQARINAYHEALKQFPEHPELHRGLALELSLGGKRDEGRALYERLEREAPDDPQIQLDLAVLYVHWGIGWAPAELRAARAWQLARARPADAAMLAAIAFVRGLLACYGGHDDTTALRVLRGLMPVTAGPLLPLAGVLMWTIYNRLEDADCTLYRYLLACLRGVVAPQDLERFPRWNELIPLVPEVAWPEDALKSR